MLYLHLSSVGFDHVLELLEAAASRSQATDNKPPFYSIRLGEAVTASRWRSRAFEWNTWKCPLEAIGLLSVATVGGYRREYLRCSANRAVQRRFRLAEPSMWSALN